MERQWTITHLIVYKDGETSAFVEAIVDTQEQATKLLQDVFEDASKGFRSRHTGAVYSNPKWLDEEHKKLQVQVSASAGYSTLSSTETFFLSWIWKEKTYNPKWILE